MNKNLVAIALSLSLAACSNGGGSGEDTTPTEQNTPATFAGLNTASVDVTNSSATEQVTVSDSDDGEANLIAQQNVTTTYGVFSISVDGNWTYQLDLSNAEVIALSANESVQDTITITSIDGTTSNIVITITGTQVAPNATFSGDLSAIIQTDAHLTVSGTITVSDENESERAFVAIQQETTLYGSFTISTSGAWQYQLDTNNAAVLALQSAEDTLTESISISSLDGSQTTVSVTISGPTAVSQSDEAMGFNATEGGNHIDGYTDAVPTVNCTQTVNSISALEDAAEDLVAGDTLCLADGQYSGDFELRVEGQGTPEAPITVAAQNPGAAIISGGEISARLGGRHVVLQGFVFRDGTSGSSIIKFEKDSECHFCRVTEMAVIDMDGGEYDSSKWIEYYGTYNRIDHSWFSGKESRGALLVLPRWIDESTFATSGFPEDRAQIDYNYFGDRPPAWGRAYAGSSDNEYEAVRLGLSTTHSAPSYSVLEYNYFERIQGEAEVISNKSANNAIRHNTVRDSHGSIVNRHGANVDIDSNFVFGDDNPFSGGIRIVDDGHRVVNNYVVGARYLSSNWNGGIVLTSGDGAGDTENGYQNVENVLIAHNTIVDSVNSLNVFGGKENEAPENIYFVNNIIANAIGSVIRTNDEGMPANSTFAGNYIFGQAFSDDPNVSEANTSGLSFIDVEFNDRGDSVYTKTDASPDITADKSAAIGDFVLPDVDIDGRTREATTDSGAMQLIADASIGVALSADDVGPKNYRPTPGRIFVESISISNHDFDTGDLTSWADEGGSGAQIVTGGEAFARDSSLMLDSNAAAVSQTVNVLSNTNYTLSAFMKGSAKLAVTVDGQTYAAERTSSNYGFSSVTFQSGAATTAHITLSVDDLVTNKADITNADFDDKQTGWTVVEGTGMGQVQDSSNSASGADGSIKFKWNVGEDTGTPHNPYIAQSISVEANRDYTLSIYNLYKNNDDNSSILFGVSTETDISDTGAYVASKDSIYSTLKSFGTDKGDDSFYRDELNFNSGNNTILTVFAQFNTTDGSEIRVDDIELSFQGAPAEGTQAYFDNIRLVSHPLSEAESQAAENN